MFLIECWRDVLIAMHFTTLFLKKRSGTSVVQPSCPEFLSSHRHPCLLYLSCLPIVCLWWRTESLAYHQTKVSTLFRSHNPRFAPQLVLPVLSVCQNAGHQKLSVQRARTDTFCQRFIVLKSHSFVMLMSAFADVHTCSRSLTAEVSLQTTPYALEAEIDPDKAKDEESGTGW